MPRSPKPKDDLAFLWDMLESARTVQELVAGKTFGDYQRSKILRLAVERSVEIIGEAARNISDARQTQHPEIPWQAIVAQRHVLAHEYAEIKDEKIWRVATMHIPELVRLIEPILEANPPPPVPPSAR